jgi:hypothetical protein
MLKRVMTISLFFLLSACVTVNITFPPAAAQKAADKIIDQVWSQDKIPEDTAGGESDAEPDEASEEATSTEESSSVLDWLVRPAQASPDFNISTPAIKAIKDRMAKRHKSLEVHYDSGAIGLTNDAFITLRDANGVPLRLRNKVKGWVKDENGDRDNLYAEIANANGHPEWKGQIQDTFAARWIKKAKKGWWYQNDKAQWVQK